MRYELREIRGVDPESQRVLRSTEDGDRVPELIAEQERLQAESLANGVDMSELRYAVRIPVGD